MFTTITTILQPFFRTTRVSRCQKRTSGLYVQSINQSDLFVTQNYTIPIKDGKIEQCVNRTQRQLRATLTGAQTDIYGKS